MAFKAVVLPMLIQASKEVTTRETRTARIGMFQPGSTCKDSATLDILKIRSYAYV